MLIPVSFVVITFNEEIHLNRLFSNIGDLTDDILVLDSGSSDNTFEICKKFNVSFFERKFDNFRNQRLHAIKELPKKYEWMFFIDADEYLTNDLKDELRKLFSNKNIDDCSGYLMKRRFLFMGKWIKYGGYYPTWLLRLFKHEQANVEREINEHITVIGNVNKLNHDFCDENLNDFTFWLNKHNKYSLNEAQAYFIQQSGKDEFSFSSVLKGSQADLKKWIRFNIWDRFVPILVRPFVYFCYRYFLRFGFLDGKTGFIYHFVHGLAFYFFIDVKIFELKKIRKTN